MYHPHVQWVVSFADATQCGDGVIYRASGFVLTSIRPNKQIVTLPDGETQTRYVLTNQNMAIRDRTAKRLGIVVGHGATMKEFIDAGTTYKPGFQLRYVFFLDPTARQRLTSPVLPFSEIDRLNARMYKGKRATSETNDTAVHHTAEGGAAPTVALQIHRVKQARVAA